MRQETTEALFLSRLQEKMRLGYFLDEAKKKTRQDYEELLTWTDDYQRALDLAGETLQADHGRIGRLTPIPIRTREHRDWYSGPDDNAVRWNALLTKMRKLPRLSDEAVQALDDQSTRVIASMNPPNGDLRTYGMVVGHIQSGKTANMIAQIAKAADERFGLIVVLAGMTDFLREQTQRRLFSDLNLQDQHLWHMLTNADMDYERMSADVLRPAPGVTMVAVVKKNPAPLKKLLQTIKDTAPPILANFPMLVIDDECDQASVNTSSQDISPINGLIRDILLAVPKSHYVGYTATPFANVLINPDIHPEREEDLYPRDFILALPKPQRYFGAQELFGRDFVDAQDALGQGMIVTINPEDIPKLVPRRRNRPPQFEPEIPPSLDSALCYFVAAVAARTARNPEETELSSMLVHVTHIIGDHDAIAAAIREWKDKKLKDFEENGDLAVESFRTVWEEQKPRVESSWWNLTPVEFSQFSRNLQDTLSAIDVILEHSESEARLNLDPESDERQENPFIVVGGNVLARGVTLPGLITTYFLRASGQYDSLMQAGRWFGFRHGYEDLPRIWMTDELATRFAELSRVENDIREEIDRYAARRITPLEVAVKIRQVPGLAVTARNKMLSAEKCEISFYGRHIQTTKFKEKDTDWLQQNLAAGASLIRSAVEQGVDFKRPRSGRGWLGEKVSIEQILTFLREYRIHQDHVDKSNEELLEYIQSENRRLTQSLSLWNVGVFETERAELRSEHTLGLETPIIRVERARVAKSKHLDADIKGLMSLADIHFDLPEPLQAPKSWSDAMEARESYLEGTGGLRPLLLLYLIAKDSQPSGRSKQARLPLNAAEDILGMGIVFPGIRDRETRAQNYVTVRLPEAIAEPDEDQKES